MSTSLNVCMGLMCVLRRTLNDLYMGLTDRLRECADAVQVDGLH